MGSKNEETITLQEEYASRHVDDNDGDVISRPQWSNRFQYILSLLGYSVGLGNLWRFPYVCQRNGGGAFLIPYVIVTIIFAMPLFYLEVCLGQFSRQGPIGVWGFCPIMTGIGFGMMTATLLLVPYYSQILTWGLYYLYKSFSPVLPWTTCGNSWNTPECVAVYSSGNTTQYNSTVDGSFNETRSLMRNATRGHSSTEEFWQYNVLGISSGLGDLGSVQPHLMLCWFLACFAVFLCLIKGVQSIGKVVYVTALMPYLLLTVLLVKSCTMPGAMDGIRYYLTPDFSRLQHPQVWLEALVQLFFSLGPAWGPLIVMSSHNRETRNTAWDTVIVCVCGEMTSFFTGFVVFSTVGYLAHSLELPVADVITSGPGIGFIVYPEAASLLPVPQLWSVLFFIVLLMMGVDSVIGYSETVIGCLEDIFGQRFPSRHLPTILGAAMMLYTFVIGIVFTTSGGIYVFQLLDWYVGAFVCFVISLLECIVVSWVYGIKQFSEDMETMTGRKLPVIFKILVAIVIPVVLIVVIIVTLMAYKPPKYGDYIYPDYASVIGWIIAVASVVPIPVIMVIQVLKHRGPFKKRLKKALTPNLSWQRARRRYGCEQNPKPLSFKEEVLFMFLSK